VGNVKLGVGAAQAIGGSPGSLSVPTNRLRLCCVSWLPGTSTALFLRVFSPPMLTNTLTGRLLAGTEVVVGVRPGLVRV
jgi:hypothetical protein